MYTKHHTECIILRAFNVGESDRAYYLLTRDLGMIYARAKSVRETRSKLRFSLQDLSNADVSLVRAKNAWKITNARLRRNLYKLIDSDKRKIHVLSRIVGLLRRLIQGESENVRLYEIVLYAVMFLGSNSLGSKELNDFEALIVLRILDNLGYVGKNEMFAYILASPYVNDMLLYETGRNRQWVVGEINRALKETQL